MMSGSPMAIHRYGAVSSTPSSTTAPPVPGERAARRDALVVELDRLRPGVAHLLEHVEHRDRLDEPVGLREGDDHPGPLRRQPAREDPLRLGAAPQGVERRLAAVRAGQQVVPLAREVGRLARERVAPVRGLVEDADEVALPHPGEVRLAGLPDLRHEREAEDRAQDAGHDLRPGGARLERPAEDRPPARRLRGDRARRPARRRSVTSSGLRRPASASASRAPARQRRARPAATGRPRRRVVGTAAASRPRRRRLVRHDRRQRVDLVGAARPARRAAAS